jgi:hypothetical protein
MKKISSWLLEFKSNVYSQAGEDGVIQKILETLSENDKWCVEFGAWDGQHFSNTCNLIENFSYSAVLIECDNKKYKDLEKKYLKNKKVITLNEFVGLNKENNLDKILKNISIPNNFDFLSIDIDGNDYHVWKSIMEYKPKVVCIEFNPTIPTEVKYIQPPDSNINQGSSLSSMVDIGKEKGYELIAVLPFNAFFVKEEYFQLFNINDNSPETLRTDKSYITYIFTGYNGKVLLSGNKYLPWHRIKYKESKVQQLPKLLRKYPSNYGKILNMIFILWQILRKLKNYFIR